ncbi:Putative glycosyl transferase family 2 [Sodalis praecaptivus]|uniref:Putative glycosyl transferase family 2 n=2 Tax=Bruguierivoracaceae TaxID=2812006 RepID=W0HWK4_9GAMM|nr:Putative glycosyl transferase family 2 [Sodalis praecaptivus]
MIPPRKTMSVVVPIYNSSSYIEQTLKSIEDSCEGYDIEAILVDDKSNDIEAVKNILKKFPFARLIEKEEKSNAAHSRNIGFEHSQYEKVFFLDSDDCFTPQYILNRNLLMDENEFGVYFGGYTTVVNNRKIISPRPVYQNDDMRDYLFLQRGDFRTSTVSIDKKYHKGTVFDPEMKKHQDWGLGIRCYDAQEKIYYDDSTYMIIHEGRNDQMSASMNIEASEYFVQNYLSDKKHLLNFVEVHIIRAICNKDYKALKFFFRLIDEISLSGKKKLIFDVLRLGSQKGIIQVTSPALYLLRRLKKALQ